MTYCKYLTRTFASNVRRRFKGVLFGRYLIVTNTLASGGLMGLGDLIQQSVDKVRAKSDERKPYDWERCRHMATVGIMLGPFIHVWYSILDRYLPGIQKTTILKKVIADQLVASPLFLLIFFTGLGTLEKKTLTESVGELKEKFPFIYAMECLVWPPAQAFNFYALRPEYRVMYVNMLILIYDCFLSYMKHQDQPISSLTSSVQTTTKSMP